ncbi:hypothetical protein [Hoeflea sp.]|uniref:hypothetical protein n=1 Tax=Hoeflea sp. TaxID=1940281 RepID=UPI003A94903D
MGNHVGNGLALAGAWRPNKHEIVALGGSHGCCQLRGIRSQRHHQFPWVIFDVDVSFRWKRRRDSGFECRVRVVYEMPHHPALPKLIRPVDQILPHQIFGEREGRQR